MAVEIVRQIEFDAPPERIGDVLVDLEGWPQWFALHKGWAGPVPTEVAVGTKFKHRVRFLSVPGEIEWTVAELILPSRFRLTGKGTSRTGAEIEFAVSTAGEASRVALDAKLTGLAIKPFEGMIRPWLDVRVERTVNALRDRLASS
jgi:uncharacterized protein YndB with AHSA1/START domain